MESLFFEIEIVTGEWLVSKVAKKFTWVVIFWRLFDIKTIMSESKLFRFRISKLPNIT